MRKILNEYLTPPLTDGISGRPFCRLTDVKKEFDDVIEDRGESGESAMNCIEICPRFVNLPCPEVFRSILLVSELLLCRE